MLHISLARRVLYEFVSARKQGGVDKVDARQKSLWQDSAGATIDSRVIKPPRSSKALQDLLLKEGLWAIDRALRHDNLKSLQADLEANLPQNSAQTRARYTQSLLRWFFPDGQVDGLATRAWKAYRDVPLETEILRALYLRAEPIMGDCVAEAIYPIEDGAVIPASYLFNYLRGKLGAMGMKTHERLKMNLRKLGFLAKTQDGRDTLKPLNPSGTAFLLLLHSLFAPSEIRTIELRNVLADNFWKHLGLKSEDSVRRFLREAVHREVIGKYIVADRIESLTTRFTLDGWLTKQVRL